MGCQYVRTDYKSTHRYQMFEGEGGKVDHNKTIDREIFPGYIDSFYCC